MANFPGAAIFSSGTDTGTPAPGGGDTATAFANITQRDAFFTTNPTFLRTGLPVSYNKGNVEVKEYWSGDDMPATYNAVTDAVLFLPISQELSSDSLILGSSGMAISSAARTVNLIDAYKTTSIPIGTQYTNAGSITPYRFKFGATALQSVASVFGSTLSDPQQMQFNVVSDTITTAYAVRPTAAGTLRVQAFAGTLITDPTILDTHITIVIGDVGNVKVIPLPNNQLITNGDAVLLRFSGVALFGGVQTSGVFDTQNVPYLDANFVVMTRNDLMAQSDPTLGVGVDVIPATESFVVGSAYDVSKADVISETSVIAQDTLTTDVQFNNDGTKMYTVGSVGDSVYQYTLSPVYDITSKVFVNAFSVGGQENNPQGMVFNNDGSKMYVIGRQFDDVFEYDLGTNFDTFTAVFLQSFSVTLQEATATDLSFNDDGLIMYVIGIGSTAVQQYALTTAFNVTTASFTQSFSLSAEDNAPHDIDFNLTGSRMYIVGRTSKSIFEYKLSVEFDVSTASILDSIDLSGTTTTPTAMAFNSDGTNVFVLDATTITVFRYDISGRDIRVLAAGDVSMGEKLTVVKDVTLGNNLTVDANTFTVNATTNRVGLKTLTPAALLSVGDSLVTGNQFAVGHLYDVGIAEVSVSQFSVAGQDTIPSDVTFNNDGSNMYMVGELTGTIYEYALSTAFLVSSASFTDSLIVTGQDTLPHGMTFNNDGSKLFMVGIQNDSVYEYNLSPDFDISTGSFVQSFSVLTEDSSPTGMAFNNDGTRMYVSGQSSNAVYEYTLPTAYSLTGAALRTSFSVASQSLQMRDVTFNSDGSRMYIIDIGNQNIFEYDLETKFRVNTSVFAQGFSVNDEETLPTGMAFNNNGSKVYIIGQTGDAVREYDINKNNFQIDTTGTGKFALALDINGIVGDLEIRNIPSPTDITANGGGIILKGDTDKTITWNSTGDVWELNKDLTFTSAGQRVFCKGITTNSPDNFDVFSLGTGTMSFVGLGAMSLLPTGNLLLNPSSGIIDAGVSRITDVVDPTGAQDAATKSYVDAHPGDVTKVGTPVNDQVAVWTGDGTLEGTTGLTYGTTLDIDGDINLTTIDGSPATVQIHDAGAAQISQVAFNFNSVLTSAIRAINTVSPDEILFQSFTASVIPFRVQMNAPSNSLQIETAKISTVLPLDMNGNLINEVTDPVSAQDAATKNYVDAHPGDVTKVGTPVNDQVGVWTGDGTLEGAVGLTYDDTDLTIAGGLVVDTDTLIVDSVTARVTIGDSATPLTDLTIFQGANSLKGITLSGTGITASSTTEGVSLVGGHLSAGNTQLWVVNKVDQGDSSKNSFRLIVGDDCPLLVGVNNIGTLNRNICFGVNGDGGNCGFGHPPAAAQADIAARVHVRTGQAGAIGLIIRAETAQSANLFEIRDQSNVVTAVINENELWGVGTPSPLTKLHIRSTMADTVPVVTTEVSGTNGGTFDKFVTGRDPNGNLLGAGGTEAYRQSGGTSRTYENLAEASSSVWHTRSLVATGVEEILTSAEFEALGTANVITISATMGIHMRANVVTPSRFVVNAGMTLEIDGGPAADLSTLTYSGTGDFFSGAGSVRLNNVLVFASAASTFMNLTGGSISILNTLILGFPTLGTILNATNFLIRFTSVVNATTGFTLTDVTSAQFLSTAYLGSPLAGAFVTYSNKLNGSNISFGSGPYTLTSTGSVIDIDTNLNDSSAVTIDDIQVATGNLYKQTTVAEVAITAVADASIANGTITAMADNSSSGTTISCTATYFDGEVITISGTTSYNGTFRIFNIVASTSFDIQRAFVADDATGTTVSERIGLTVAVSHGIVAADSIKVKDTNFYNEFNTVLIAGATLITVNGNFISTNSGNIQRDVGLDQTDPRVRSRFNPRFADSQTIACAHVNNNSTANGTIINNVYTDMVFGTAGAALVASSSMERWRLIDELNGTFEHTALEPSPGLISFDFTVTSSGGTVDFKFKWVKAISTTITATTIAFVDSNPDTITDSGNGFLTAGFAVDDTFAVTGSTGNSSNFTIATVVAGTITLVASDTLVAESAGPSITINGLFGNLEDNVESLVAVGSSAQSVTKTFPLVAALGEKIKSQITRVSGSAGITASYVSVYSTAR